MRRPGLSLRQENLYGHVRVILPLGRNNFWQVTGMFATSPQNLLLLSRVDQAKWIHHCR